jgi:hypothetical protein
MSGNAKVRQSNAEELLNPFGSREVFAVDEVQRRQFALGKGFFATEYYQGGTNRVA